MSVLKVKNGDQWDIVPAIKGDIGDPAADESITDDMLVPDGIKTEIEWLWGNQLMNSREGELLHVEDAYTAPAVDISVDGKSTQATTTGKNLLNPDFSYWTSYNLPDIGTRKGILIPVNTGTYNYHNLSNIDMMYGWVDDADNVESTYIDGANITQHFNAGTQIVADGTHPFILICTYTGTPQQNVYDRQPMLEYGTTNTGYEPYTGGKPSPSPDWPQEIVSMENPELAFHGENMWGGSKMAEDFNALKAVIYGSNEHGDYIEFEHGGGLPGGITFYPCPFKDNTQYTVVLAFENTRETSGSTTIVVVYTDGTIKEISGPNADGSYAQFVFVTAANKTVDHLRGTLRTVNNRYYYNQCGIFEGVHTVADFQPYSSAAASLLPDGYSIRSLPNGTKDELHLSYLRPSTHEGWAWYSRELAKRVGEVDLGTLAWINYYGNYVYYAQVSGFSAIIDTVQAMCEIYQPYSTQMLGLFGNRAPDYSIAGIGASSSIGVKLPSSAAYESVAAFKAAMSGVIAYYTLATPIAETLDPIELPIMPSKDTTIWSDPLAQLKMTYIQDTNLVIESLEATVADMATS